MKEGINGALVLSAHRFLAFTHSRCVQRGSHVWSSIDCEPRLYVKVTFSPPDNDAKRDYRITMKRITYKDLIDIFGRKLLLTALAEFIRKPCPQLSTSTAYSRRVDLL
ncbi:hypothetical protein L596_025025 [Steinernema carpocapsae]|uniref:Uncharacterized protein n=1 Tax=Steinernema carpocapsae TaxID=34508 RepID=A0A4U5M6K9_STECR|nr:hypothetical protein L596_025025 [Steinernema carpocapsae]